MYSALFKKILAGDKVAFSELYDELFDELFGYALRLGYEREKCKDAIHDVFCKIYSERENLGHIENIRYYLFVSVRNRLSNIYRKQSKREAPLDDKREPDVESPSALNELIDREVERQVNERLRLVLRSLSERQRRVIHYRFVLNMSFREIGQLLDIKPDSAKKFLYRTLNQVREENKEGEPIYFFTNNF